MKLEDMPVVEATGCVTFVSNRRLIDHLVKHVLEQRDERWDKVLGVDLQEARVEYRAGQTGRAFKSVARAYQGFISRKLTEICARGIAHRHSCQYRWDLAEMARDAIAQEIDGWPDEEKVLLVARACVRNEGISPYKILTAFRPWPRLTSGAFRRKLRERLRHRQTVHTYELLEVHDP